MLHWYTAILPSLYIRGRVLVKALFACSRAEEISLALITAFKL